MHMTFNGADGLLLWGTTALALLGSLIWIVIGWRAMRAHERLAIAIERIATYQMRTPLPRAAGGAVGSTSA